jgi:hypothetical protein
MDYLCAVDCRQPIQHSDHRLQGLPPTRPRARFKPSRNGVSGDVLAHDEGVIATLVVKEASLEEPHHVRVADRLHRGDLACDSGRVRADDDLQNFVAATTAADPARVALPPSVDELKVIDPIEG